MSIIYKTTFRREGALNLYKVEKLLSFNPDGYTLSNPYFGGINKYKVWTYTGAKISRFIKKDVNGILLEEVIIRSQLN